MRQRTWLEMPTFVRHHYNGLARQTDGRWFGLHRSEPWASRRQARDNHRSARPGILARRAKCRCLPTVGAVGSPRHRWRGYRQLERTTSVASRANPTEGGSLMRRRRPQPPATNPPPAVEPSSTAPAYDWAQFGRHRLRAADGAIIDLPLPAGADRQVWVATMWPDPNVDGGWVRALWQLHPTTGRGWRIPLQLAAGDVLEFVDGTPRTRTTIGAPSVAIETASGSRWNRRPPSTDRATGSVPGGSVPGAVAVEYDGAVVEVVVELVAVVGESDEVVVGEVDDVALVGAVVFASWSFPEQAASSATTTTRTPRSGSRRFTRLPPRSSILPTALARARPLRMRTASWIVRRVGLRQRSRRPPARRG